MSMSDPATGTSPEDLHSLVLVLSSAHSGATLLCNDIGSLGGLGMPKEYLRGIKSQSATASESDVSERLAMGVREDAPGVGSVLLMVPQVPVTYQALCGKRIPAMEALPGVVRWAQGRFERLLVVFLVRNAIDQAISYVVADAAEGGKKASRRAEGDPGPERPAREIPNINQLILANLGRVVRDRRILFEAYGQFADTALWLTYDELEREPAGTAAKLVAHARGSGFEVKNDAVQRTFEESDSTRWVAEVRDGFLHYLKTETGVEPSNLDGSFRPVLDLDPADQ